MQAFFYCYANETIAARAFAGLCNKVENSHD